MSTIKRIVCLANSRMDGGRCVAGKELKDGVPGRWIRPVGKGASKAVPARKDLKLLDIIDISLSEPMPNLHQQENWLLGPSHFPLARHGRWSDLEQLLDPVEPLWIEGYDTSNAVNDRIPNSQISGINSSLRFILVHELILRVHQGKLRGCFQHDRIRHDLVVTDSDCEKRYRRMKIGTEKPLGRSFLTVSLAGDSFKGAYYRIIAAILPRGRKEAT